MVMNLLAWRVGPPDFEWVGIVHAPTRGKAKQKAVIEVGDYLDVRARRLPQFDNAPVTEEALLKMGWSDPEYPDHPLDPQGYTFLCGCEICRQD
jgi:hypothetical protein